MKNFDIFKLKLASPKPHQELEEYLEQKVKLAFQLNSNQILEDLFIKHQDSLLLEKCQVKHDRDVNASMNILRHAQPTQKALHGPTVGSTVSACGVSVSLAPDGKSRER